MAKAEPKVAVVIVNWNRRDLLLEAVGSCFASGWQNLNVIIVDNGSQDGSVDAVKEAYPQTEIITNKENLGFAVGSNQGIEKALIERADYILFLNNDATLEKSLISNLVALLEGKPEAGAAAPFIFYHDKPDTIWYGGGIVAFWRGLIAHCNIRRKFDNVKHKAATTDYLTGCTFMVKAEILKQVGGFDTTLGMYSEDVDLSLRLRRKGYKLYVTPDARAYHRVSASAGGELSPFKAFHRGRSNALLVKRWARWWEYPTLILSGFFGIVIIGLKLLFSGKFPTAAALIRGISNGLLGLRVPPHYRLKQQS